MVAASLAFGIMSIFFSSCGLLYPSLISLAFALFGLIPGVVAVVVGWKNKFEPIATAGFITGAVGVFVGVLSILISTIFVAAGMA